MKVSQKMSRRRFSKHLFAAPLAPLATLAACGGGGSSTSTNTGSTTPTGGTTNTGNTQTTPVNTPVVSNPPFQIAGFNINMYGNNRLKRATNYTTSLDSLAATGANTVMVTTPYFQKTATSSDLGADARDTESDANLIELFQAIRSRKLTPAYKFTVIPQDGSWSGAIAPANIDAYFASYQSHLVRLAQIAQAEGVTLLYIANEMESLAKSAYASKWNTLLDEVRKVYSGRLSWNAVLNSTGFPNGEAFKIPVASRLDHIGLSAYDALTDKKAPTVAELRQAWSGNRLGRDLVSMVKSLNQATGRPIVFSELCYRSVDGNNIAPYDWQAKTTDVQDPQEQADCYEAFMRVWTAQAQPWMHGVLWWQWMIEPTPDRFVSHDQTPQGGLAQNLITGWFTVATK